MYFSKIKLKTILVFLLGFISIVGCSSQMVKAPVHSSDLASAADLSRRDDLYSEIGIASWYGPGFQGRKTASGKRFNTYELTCAHRKLPFGTKLQVTNLENGQSTQVIVNDRGPYYRSRVLDLSYEAAKRIGLIKRGYGKVVLKEVI